MIAIDAGNTLIACAVFDGEEIGQVHRISTQACLQSGSFLGNLPMLPDLAIEDVVLSSVRRQVKDLIISEIKAKTGSSPFVVDVTTDMGIINLYETKQTLGVDRVICAAAGFHLYSRGVFPLVIIDMGTATTIDYLTEKGEYLGGIIAPGLMSAYDGLLERAPELPRLDVRPGGPLIGKTTDQCILSGVIHGHSALIERVVDKMVQERGTDAGVLLTGGFSAVLRDLLPHRYVHDQDLILKGLRTIYNFHRENKC